MCATQYGCMANSVMFLDDMLNSNESELKPTLFIQSTHNTMAAMVAIKQQNHGYNITYSHKNTSWEDAILDVSMQIQLGMLESALVIEFDEYVEKWDGMLQAISLSSKCIAKAQIISIQE